ncbi:MAG TPA: inositol monophosphatase family protein [Steroidobacteraceae bacterium]|jgi:myo-inositol-1(or 4)-monophosphatase|nr:inositol monophosphatase family protein [Steroidobacteraceae bacterium]
MSFTGHPDFARALALAEQLADVARRIARQHFRTPVAVDRKSDGTPVTAVDRGIETEMRHMIRTAFPAHAIRGEEFAPEGRSEFTWVLDPIDGTKSFITGYPLFGALIALCQGERPVLGVIEAPALAERWVGCEGRPTLFNGAAARTRACRSLAEAVMYTTTLESYSAAERHGFEALAGRTALRRFGGDCYLFGMLASGWCDLALEVRLKPHDFMALIPVVEGAGGKVSDWRGEPLRSGGDGRLVAAATEELWRQALEVLGTV